MQNLEIKCRYEDHRRAERLAREALGATRTEELRQTDTYFAVPAGRLKLRRIREGAADRYELIFYRRADRASARASTYEILDVAEGPQTLKFLARALGVKVRVEKRRRVYLK